VYVCICVCLYVCMCVCVMCIGATSHLRSLHLHHIHTPHSLEKSQICFSDECETSLRDKALRVLGETDYTPPLYCLFEVHGQLQTVMQFNVRNIARLLMQLFLHRFAYNY
jgi:hypothetical protein